MKSLRQPAFVLALVVIAAPAWAQTPGEFRRPCVAPGSPPNCDAVPSGPRGALPTERDSDRPTSSSTILQLPLNKTPEAAAKPPTQGTVTVNPNTPQDAPLGAAPKGSPLKPEPAGPQPASPPPASPQ